MHIRKGSSTNEKTEPNREFSKTYHAAHAPIADDRRTQHRFRPLAGWERAVFAVAALAGFLGIAFNDKAYYTMHAALFIGMAVILHTTRNRYLERAKAQAPE